MDWINTRNTRPVISGSFLVWDGGGAQIMHYDAAANRFYVHWWSDVLCSERFPTHWMPMPDAPKEVHDE